MASAMLEPSLGKQADELGNGIRIEVLKRALAAAEGMGWRLQRVAYHPSELPEHLKEAVRDTAIPEGKKSLDELLKEPLVESYRYTVRPLSAEDGGGYLIEFPDLPGCMSDGETEEEAIANGRIALRRWLEARAAVRFRQGWGIEPTPPPEPIPAYPPQPKE